MKIKLRLESPESRRRWDLIKQASREVSDWDELKKAEAYRRTRPIDEHIEKTEEDGSSFHKAS